MGNQDPAQTQGGHDSKNPAWIRLCTLKVHYTMHILYFIILAKKMSVAQFVSCVFIKPEDSGSNLVMHNI